jgi:hypothetical protein
MKIIYLLFVIICMMPVVNSSTIYISPLTQTVDIGDEFYVDVYCVPSQPIKAFEFRLNFNELVINAMNISEGTIFNGYQTFFNHGDINNIDGTITKVYDVILGQGNVSVSGSFAKIKFKAIASGTANISLMDNSFTGICNETGYLAFVKFPGNIIVNTIHMPDDTPPSDDDKNSGGTSRSTSPSTPHNNFIPASYEPASSSFPIFQIIIVVTVILVVLLLLLRRKYTSW